MMNKFMAVLAVCFALCLGAVIYADVNGGLQSAPTQAPDAVSRPPELVYFDEEDVTSVPEQEQARTELLPSDISSMSMEDLFFAVEGEAPSNGELQLYLSSQTKIEDSRMEFTALPEYATYLSGKAESKIAIRYGTFEFQVCTVHGNGLFPAIWLLPNSNVALPEIDIYEAIGNDPDKFYGVMHYMEDDDRARSFFEYEFPEDEIPESYRVRFEWYPDGMHWYLNGEKIYSITEDVPEKDMYMMLNLAVGGRWAGAPGEDTVFPTVFTVDVLEFRPQRIIERF